MNKTRKTILGLILGLILVFGGVFSLKATELTPITSVRDILEGSEIAWNSSITLNTYLSDIVQGQIEERHADYLFSCEGTHYYSIGFDNSNSGSMYYDSTKVYSVASGWVSQSYRTIETEGEFTFFINGTDDNTNADLIAFINSSAVITNTQHTTSFTITLNANGGEFISIGTGNTYLTRTLTSSYGSTSSALTDFFRSYDIYRSNYTFIGWNTYSGASSALSSSYLDELNDDTLLYAVWEFNSGTYYTVSFNGNGADSGTPPATQSLLAGTTYYIPQNAGSLVKNGYTFAGWAINSSSTTPVYAISEIDQDIELYAIWQAGATYVNIIFNANGADSGTAPATISAQVNSTITLPGNTGNLTKQGYTFIGWNTGPNATTALSELRVPSLDRTLYAVWKLDESAQYSTMNIYINNNLVGSWKVYGVVAESGANAGTGSVDFGFRNLDENFFQLTLGRINALVAVEQDEAFIWGTYSDYITFVFNGEYLSTATIKWNNELMENISREDLEAANGSQVFSSYYEHYGVINVYLNVSSFNGDMANFRNIVANIFNTMQTFLNLQIGWFTIGGIVAVVLVIAVVFFIFKIARGGGGS